jgi:hypothetical protein
MGKMDDERSRRRPIMKRVYEDCCELCSRRPEPIMVALEMTSASDIFKPQAIHSTKKPTHRLSVNCLEQKQSINETSRRPFQWIV